MLNRRNLLNAAAGMISSAAMVVNKRAHAKPSSGEATFEAESGSNSAEISASRVVRPFKVACMQTMIRLAPNGPRMQATVNENLYRGLSLVDYLSSRFGVMGGPTKFVVFPEFFMQGVNHLRTLAENLDATITIPGRETEELSKAAQAYKLYIAGGALEVDPNFPGRFFNTAFMIDPSGDIVLRYRQLNPHGGIALFTSPADVYSEYLDRYGIEGLFPVVDTPYGKVGCIIGYDHAQPELARCLAMRGAELILEVAGEPYMEDSTGYEKMRQSRAIENLCYWAAANHGLYISPVGDRFNDSSEPVFQRRVHEEVAPTHRTPGRSQVVDFHGRVLAMIDGPGEASVQATLDMNSLRFRRSEVGMNYLVQVRTAMLADLYRQMDMYPVNAFADKPAQEGREFTALHIQVIERLQRDGILVPPPA